MHDGGLSIKNYLVEAGRDVASMVHNEQQKCTATLPLYITSESAVSRTNFSTLLLPRFYEKIQIFGFPCCSTHEGLSIDASISCQCRTDIDEAKVI